MKASFNYNRYVTFESVLDVDDIFNACLEADSGYALSFMITKTICGKTHILQFGPVSETCETFSLSYETMRASDKQVKAKIAKFICQKDITDVRTRSEGEILQSIPEIDSFWPMSMGEETQDEE